MSIDLSKLTVEQLRRALAEKEKEERSGKKKKQSVEVLKPRTKSEKQKEIRELKSKSEIRKVQNVKAQLKIKRELRDQKRKREGKLVPTGKYQRKQNWVEITLDYKVHVYEGGKKIGDYKDQAKDYFGIRWMLIGVRHIERSCEQHRTCC